MHPALSAILTFGVSLYLQRKERKAAKQAALDKALAKALATIRIQAALNRLMGEREATTRKANAELQSIEDKLDSIYGGTSFHHLVSRTELQLLEDQKNSLVAEAKKVLQKVEVELKRIATEMQNLEAETEL